MPYSEKQQLPPGIRNSLPREAQQVYIRAFNETWEKHPDMDFGDRQEVSHRKAWAAVKKRFERGGSAWHVKYE